MSKSKYATVVALFLAVLTAQACAPAGARNPTSMSEARMKPRIQVITLAVDDLEKSLAFYRDGLGLTTTKGIVGTELEDGAVVFFDMNDKGLIFALYPRVKLAKDANVPVSAPSTSELSIGHFVSSKAEVDSVLARAKKAGATITDPARDRFWGGYAGYFQDVDGHLWEIGWNRQLDIKD